MGRKTVSMRVLGAKTIDKKVEILSEWLDAWRAEQRDLVRRLVAGAERRDVDEAEICTGQIRVVTDKKFKALYRCLYDIGLQDAAAPNGEAYEWGRYQTGIIAIIGRWLAQRDWGEVTRAAQKLRADDQSFDKIKRLIEAQVATPVRMVTPSPAVAPSVKDVPASSAPAKPDTHRRMEGGTHQAFMEEALREARLAAAAGEIPVGAVVVKDGKIIARAHNEREKDGDPTGHAEILALRRAAEHLGGWRLTGCTMYVTLEPCPMCAGALMLARLSHIYFGASDPKMGCCGSVYRLTEDPAFGLFTPATGGLMAAECTQALTGFFDGRRR